MVVSSYSDVKACVRARTTAGEYHITSVQHNAQSCFAHSTSVSDSANNAACRSLGGTDSQVMAVSSSLSTAAKLSVSLVQCAHC